MSHSEQLPPFHPFIPHHYQNPYPHLAEAREQCPVGRFGSPDLPGVDFFYLALDADVRTALNSSQLSNAGNFELAKELPPVITQLDGEQHKQLRAILEQSFNAQAYKEARPFIEQKANALLNQMLTQPERQTDFITAIARPLPLATLAYIVGFPQEDAEKVGAWNAAINAIIPGDFYHTDVWQHFEGYIWGLIAGYRMAEKAPDNIISRLLQTNLSPDEILMTIFQLLVAGADTTTLLLGNLLYELLREPSRWQAVLNNPRLIPSVIEETLRLHPSLNWVMRSCPTGITLHEETLPKGSRVVVGIASANRDEARWGTYAQEFELERPKVANHVTFGAGQHFCLGAQLARLQATVVLQTLLEHAPTLGLVQGYQYDALDAPMIHGPKSLPVAW